MIKSYYIKLFLAPVLWGGALIAGRIVAVDIPPFTTTFLRYVAVSFFLLPILHRKNKKFPVPGLGEWVLIFIVSISGVLLFNYFLFSSLRTITAIRSSIFIAATPSAIAIISTIFFHEKISISMIIGILFAFTGTVITLSNGNLMILFEKSLSIGDLYLLGCILAWSAYSISAKYSMLRLSALTVLAYSSLVGVFLLIPFVLMEGVLPEIGSIQPKIWLSLLYLSIGAAGIAHLWYYEGIQVIGVSKSAVFLNIEPIAAITLGILILGEKLTLPSFFGAVLVITGLFLTNYGKKDKANPE